MYFWFSILFIRSPSLGKHQCTPLTVLYTFFLISKLKKKKRKEKEQLPSQAPSSQHFQIQQQGHQQPPPAIPPLSATLLHAQPKAAAPRPASAPGLSPLDASAAAQRTTHGPNTTPILRSSTQHWPSTQQSPQARLLKPPSSTPHRPLAVPSSLHDPQPLDSS